MLRLSLILIVAAGLLEADAIAVNRKGKPAPTRHLTKSTGNGTSPNLEAIFIGRCWEYQQFFYPIGPRFNCPSLWNLFFNAFAFKDPCHIRLQDYDPFINMVYDPLPLDKTILWSGTYRLVNAYVDQRRRFVALRDTMLGYMVDSAIWCGSIKAPGYNATSCPKPFSGDCGVNQTIYDESYWGAVSKAFAKASYGVVSVLLNGTRRDGRPAYSNENFFHKYELPNLQTNQVHTLRVMVAHDIGVPNKEMCHNGSLPALKTEVAKYGFQYQCVDDPDDIVHLLCVDDPTSHECMFANAKLVRHSYDVINVENVINYFPRDEGASTGNSKNYSPMLVVILMLIVASF